MKVIPNKLLRVFLIAGIFFFFKSEFNLGQELVPTYTDQSPGLFAGYSQPISIAILKFEGDNDIEENLYNELKSNSDVLNKFVLFSYEVLEQQKKALGLKTLDPNNSKVLKQLYNMLDIKLIITGSSETDGRFYLKIIETSDNSEVYGKEYQDTKQSTAISDAVKLFSDNKTTDYLANKEVVNNFGMVHMTLDDNWKLENNILSFSNGDTTLGYKNTIDSYYGNCTVAVKARYDGGATNNGFGILFGKNKSSNIYYTFLIDQNGYYALFKYDGSNWNSLVPWKFTSLVSNGFNDLKVTCNGKNITAYINNSLVVEIQDETLSGGDIGLFCNGTVDASFEDFIVSEE